MERKLMIDSAHGVYLPCVFANSIDLKYWEGIDQECLDILQDVEHPDYWEVWETVLLNAQGEVDGKKYYLEQTENGDLWLIPIWEYRPLSEKVSVYLLTHKDEETEQEDVVGIYTSVAKTMKAMELYAESMNFDDDYDFDNFRYEIVDLDRFDNVLL